ncbi:hypothetical protein AC578_2030 [Pseudocercospora eumusae]|uniref:Uncharacterized protein n=1 Tax=Pseudocercospora eumusae TaxID=321146 RepID=A0A139HHI5_9PEZI|nr:hypothetical protein AC578_2030 [Pseudocercospora eumusae]
MSYYLMQPLGWQLPGSAQYGYGLGYFGYGSGTGDSYYPSYYGQTQPGGHLERPAGAHQYGLITGNYNGYMPEYSSPFSATWNFNPYGYFK